MSLPIFQDDNKNFTMMQTKWAAALEPIIDLPLNDSVLLKGVVLTTGTNQVNHKLGRKIQGWIVVRQRSAASFYDTQDLNQHPTLTLSLVSSANVTVDLVCF